MRVQLPSDAELDRLRELVSIGAGHAATAFGDFVGRSFRMRVPTIRILRAEAAGALFVQNAQHEEVDMAGIFFTVRGGLGGLVALLVPGPIRDRVLDLLLRRPLQKTSAEQRESALRELGNILASHVVSAIGETLNQPVLPSVPLLTMDDGFRALGGLIAHEAGENPVVRVETEIVDESGDLRALLVLVPELQALPILGPHASGSPGTPLASP